MKTKDLRTQLGRAVLAGAATSWSMSPATALAQTNGDPMVARQLFRDARALAAGGHYEQACPKFEESLKQESGIGTLFNLADCWERTGRTASAWARFLDAASMARQAGQPDREKVARDRASQLEGRLSRLTIDVDSTAPGLVVTRNATTAVDRAVWGSAVPVDPGSYTIEAKAPGRKTWKSAVTIASAAGTVKIRIPELAVETASASTPDSVKTSLVPETAAIAEGSHSESTQKTIALVVAGVGVVGVAGGIVFGLRAKSKADSLANICAPGAICTQPDIDGYAAQRSEGVSARTISVVGFAVGGAALAAAAALFFTAPSTARTKSSQVGVWTDGRASLGIRFESAWQ